MLLNFCDPRLRAEVTCSTVSTEGYEVANLTSSLNTGFLAYSCIKPPISIDLTFICNVQLSHVIVWPNVGAQKSSGFELSGKSSDAASEPYVPLSTAYLGKREAGVLFYRRDVDQSKISAPPNFLRRYIRVTDQRLVNGVIGLRINILKTENSVPALGRIEVWGRVSRRCGKDVSAGVGALWTAERDLGPAPKSQLVPPIPPAEVNESQRKTKASLQIPEDFLDPITYEVMIQPITLPSGKIIDHRTLEKHEQNEAIWGRTPSDPFTGIPFSEVRKPVAATALKARIDKYLLENSNAEEIKNLPRILGHKGKPPLLQNRVLEISELVSENNEIKNNSTVVNVRPNYFARQSDSVERKGSQHKLPIVCSKRRADNIDARPSKIKKTLDLSESENKVSIEDHCEDIISSEIDSNLELNVKTVLSGLKRFSEPQTYKLTEILNSCPCCTGNVLYKLPCHHIVCRKVLTSNKNLTCGFCGSPYKTSDPSRIHE